MKNLELFNSNSINGFNLSDTIDETITSMGSRKLKSWIAFPLIDKKGIVRYSSENQPRFDHHPTTGVSLGLYLKGNKLIIKSIVHSCLKQIIRIIQQ